MSSEKILPAAAAILYTSLSDDGPVCACTATFEAPWQHTYWALSSIYHGLVRGCMRAIWCGVASLLPLMVPPPPSAFFSFVHAASPGHATSTTWGSRRPARRRGSSGDSLALSSKYL